MEFSTPTGCPNFTGCPNGCPNYPVVCAFDILIYIITLSTVHIMVPFTGLLNMYLKFYFLLMYNILGYLADLYSFRHTVESEGVHVLIRMHLDFIKLDT